jgi:membrane peptidoglycan carboxypeptidase
VTPWLRTPFRLVLALVCSVLVGLLAAAIAFPIVAGAGVAARAGAQEYLVLPADLDDPKLAKRSRILASDGSLIAYLYLENRVPVELERVPEVTRQAVIAIEDARFYEHEGVDLKGLTRAVIANARSGDVEQGASTLTQQYVKNARLYAAKTAEERQAALEVSLERKLQEARYAMQLERQLSKDEILERYLNIAYYGNGAYGIGTAASYYFGKPVEELSLPESALLAGIVQRPSLHDPVDNPENAVSRRNVVLSRMAQVGFISELERAVAAGSPLELKVEPMASGCEAPGVQAPFFCDYVRRALEEGPLGAALGDTREERQQRLLGDGLTVRTTLNPGIQQTAIHTLDKQIPQDDPSGVATTFTAVKPGTGEVLALATNRTFGEEDVPGQTKLNLPLGGSSGMQMGSAFKPFVLAAALEQGLPLNTTFNSPGEYTSEVFKNCDGQTCDNPYTVRNAGDSNAGRHDLVSGTRNSVNTFYLQLLEKTGPERPAQIAEGFGLRQFVDGRPQGPLHRGGSLVLGVNEVSPLALTAAYAGLAARGLYCPPRPVTAMFENDGTPIEIPEQECKRVLPPETVDTMASIMRGTVDGPWSRTARRASIGRPVAGKTGTTNGSKAAWFVGFTPQIAAAVWVGKPIPEPLQNITINGQYYRQVYGGTLPAPTWSLIMGHVLRNAPVAELPPPAISQPTPAKPERERGRERGDDGDDD